MDLLTIGDLAEFNMELPWDLWIQPVVGSGCGRQVSSAARHASLMMYK